MAAAHKPTDTTRAEVAALASYGVTQAHICEYIGVSLKTLHKHYRAEIDQAELRANAKVAKFLLHAASGDALKDEDTDAKFPDCLRAAMFWAKTRMGMKEGLDVNLGNQGGQEFKVKFVKPKPGG